MSRKPNSISFNRHVVSAIENTSLGSWPAHPLDFGKPMKAVTRRPVGQVSAKSGKWTHKGTLWRFKPQQGRHVSIQSPWGTAGDRLWVREPWSTLAELDDLRPGELPREAPIFFGSRLVLGGRRRQSLHLPFTRRRFDVGIHDIRVEALNCMAQTDFILEGLTTYLKGIPRDWRDIWTKAWNNVYGSRYPAASNPWVFRIELIFKPVNR